MKLGLGLFLVVGALATTPAGFASTPNPAGSAIERGPKHKVIEVTRATTNDLGQVTQTTNRI